MTRARRGGFTLLEVVLAMGILALIATICYGAFWLGIRAVDKGEAAVVTAQRLRVASDVLIRQIKSTVVQEGCKREDDEPFLYFNGRTDGLRFVTATGQLSGGGMAQVWYEAVNGQLLLHENPAFSPDALANDLAVDPGALRTALLLDGFTDLTFCYLPADEAATSEKRCGIREPGFGGWVSEWDSDVEEVLPRAVAIAVKGLPGLDTDVWVQQIPLMTWSMPGENTESEGEGCELCDQHGGGTIEGTDETAGGNPTGTGSSTSNGATSGTTGKGDESDESDTEAE